MNKQKFFAVIRKDVTGGKLTATQVIGFEYLLDQLVALKLHADFVAYILATAYWETARTMEPVREAYWLSEDWRRKNLRYFPWYGRGYVQLTWEANYLKAKKWFKEVLGLDRDLIADPDLALDRETSSLVTIVGMVEGWFTGKKLGDYLVGNDLDFIGARRVVNGKDKAKEIAEIALDIAVALEAAGYTGTETKPDFTVLYPKVTPGKPEIVTETKDAPRPLAGLLLALGGFGVVALAILEALGVL